MSWNQLVTPNLGITYTGGWCLKAVEDAFNTDHLYPSAIDSWNAGNGNHPGEQPPAGVAVPVYFTIGSTPAGHIAISLPDGRVASSTQEGEHQGLYIHPTLQDLINIYTQYDQGCTYLGWSERLANTQIVADQGAADDMDPKQIAHGVNVILGCNWPEDIEQQKADFMSAAGNIQQVLKDGLQAAKWRSDWDHNHDALVSYRDTFAIPGDDPNQWATDRQMGGMTFDSQVHQELPPILANSNKADSLAQQLAQATADRNAAIDAEGQAQKAAETAAKALSDLQNAPKDSQTVDCQQQAAAAVQTALTGVQANPWPYVWQWIKGGGK